MCGLCGNSNGDLKDDFTTRYSSVATGALEFGNSWKTSQECSDTVTQTFPCDSNPYCKAWAVRKCEIIRDSTFRECHSKVGGSGRGEGPAAPSPQALTPCPRRRWTPAPTTTRASKKPAPATWRASTWASARRWPCTPRRAARLASVSRGESPTSVVSAARKLFCNNVIR